MSAIPVLLLAAIIAAVRCVGSQRRTLTDRFNNRSWRIAVYGSEEEYLAELKYWTMPVNRFGRVRWTPPWMRSWVSRLGNVRRRRHAISSLMQNAAPC